MLTGLRRANVFGLRWSQFDEAAGVVAFPGMKMKNGRPHAVPLGAEALAIVEQQPRVNAFVFGGSRGPTSRQWARALRQAELTDVRFHDLRHTWASWLRVGGASLLDLQELGGWRSPAMVQRYAHANVEHLRERVETLGTFAAQA